MQTRTTWGGRFIYIMTLAGATIGYGAAWRFPYLVGENGGGAFLVVLFLVMLLFGLPLLIAETLIGRKGSSNVIDAFDHKNKSNKKPWKFIGYLAILGTFGILSYYVVISAWVIHFLVSLISGDLNISHPITTTTATIFYDEILRNPALLVCYALLFILANYYILAKGIKAIEKTMVYLMPILMVIVILMAIRGVTLPGASEGILFYVNPDFTKITSASFIAALGQVFFGLSLGFGVMITLGSYVKKEENIFYTSFLTTIINIVVPFFIGFIIFPAIFAFGFSPAEGPSLVFKVLPMVFSHMAFGQFIAILFFVLVFLDALTSSITIYEVAITTIIEKLKVKRQTAACLVFSISFVLGNIPCILSSNIWKNVTVFGKNIFDTFDYASANILLTITSLLTSIYVGYILNKTTVLNELTNNGIINKKLAHIWLYFVRYVVPILILLVFFVSL